LSSQSDIALSSQSDVALLSQSDVALLSEADIARWTASSYRRLFTPRGSTVAITLFRPRRNSLAFSEPPPSYQF
jgi:hypothetical protein